jgi:hypothetical protein
MDVRGLGGRIVERSDADETDRRTPAIVAPKGCLAPGATVGTLTGRGSPLSSAMRSVSMRALSTKALPVCLWQSRQ